MTEGPTQPGSHFPDEEWARARTNLIYYFSRHGHTNAPDLAQDTVTRVLVWLDRGGSITGQDGLMKTIYGFARNVHRENVAARNRILHELPQEVPAEENETLRLNTREAARMLEQVLERLPAAERKLILLAEQMSQQELAERMNVPISTLRVWLYRTRHKLRKLEEGNEPGKR